MALRAQVIRSGLHLGLLHIAEMPLRFVGMLLLTRAIGPAEYGLYMVVFGLNFYLERLSNGGISIYLVRENDDDPLETLAQGFTLLLAVGIATTAAGLLAIPLIQTWTRLPQLAALAATALPVLPVILLNQVPIAFLERRLEYRLVALVTFGGQVVYYAVAVSLALWGWGAWAAVAGLWSQQVLASCVLYGRSGYRPRLRWNRREAMKMLRYSRDYLVVTAGWDLSHLVSPMLVSRYWGAEAVGHIALAHRLVEMLSFGKWVAQRVGTAALGRVQADPGRMTAAMSEGMRLQVLTVGPLLVGFGLVSPWILPPIFGDRWLPVTQVYPFIALAGLTGALFALHTAAFLAIGRPRELGLPGLVHVSILATVTFLLVRPLGPVGFGWASLAALPAYVLVHRATVRYIGSPEYGLAMAWWAAFGLALFTHRLGLWAMLGLVAALLLPATWRRFEAIVQELRSLRHPAR